MVAPTNEIPLNTVGADSISARITQTARTKQNGGMPNHTIHCRGDHWSPAKKQMAKAKQNGRRNASHTNEISFNAVGRGLAPAVDKQTARTNNMAENRIPLIHCRDRASGQQVASLSVVGKIYFRI